MVRVEIRAEDGYTLGQLISDLLDIRKHMTDDAEVSTLSVGGVGMLTIDEPEEDE
jgi:hypothetical protein